MTETLPSSTAGVSGAFTRNVQSSHDRCSANSWDLLVLSKHNACTQEVKGRLGSSPALRLNLRKPSQEVWCCRVKGREWSGECVGKNRRMKLAKGNSRRVSFGSSGIETLWASLESIQADSRTQDASRERRNSQVWRILRDSH